MVDLRSTKRVHFIHFFVLRFPVLGMKLTKKMWLKIKGVHEATNHMLIQFYEKK